MNACSHIGNKTESVLHQGLNDCIQPKLKNGQPDDKYEQEADRMADAVMRMPDLQLQMQPMEETGSSV